MSRSLFLRLHRRFGQRVTGDMRIRLSAFQNAWLERNLPLNLLTPARSSPLARPLRVAVIGGGFAGMAAAWALQNMFVQVTVFEARDKLGGRVDSSETMVGHRIVERGAELIGANHPLWIRFARHFGLGLSVITDDDEYAAATLRLRVAFDGRVLSQAELRALYAGMLPRFFKLTRMARIAFRSTSPLEPWKVPGAAGLDSRSVASWINSETPPGLVRKALTLEISNDLAVAADRISLLAMLTQIAGGGMGRYWEDTEVFRCEDGNVSIARNIAKRLTEPPRPFGLPVLPAGKIIPAVVTQLKVANNQVEVVASPRETRAPRVSTFDYVVLAVPPSVWSRITVIGAQLPPAIQLGPALKFMAETKSRYWVRPGHAPSGWNDRFGQLWEATDNQARPTDVVLTVFAGGPNADRAPRTGPVPYFANAIDTLLPGFKDERTGRFSYANWTVEPHIETGYSCPAPGQVMTILRTMQQPIGGRIFLAGEHVSPPFFGFMEGALETGISAAQRIFQAAGVSIPAQPVPATLPAPTPSPTRRPRPTPPARVPVPA